MTIERYSTGVLHVVAAAVMRAHLEYEATGDSARLRRYLTPEATSALDSHQPAVDPATGSAVAAIGPYAAVRLDDDRAYVCAGLLHPSGGDAVLAVELVAQGGRILATRIGRAADPTTPGLGVAPEPGPVGSGQRPPEPPQYLRAVLGEFPQNAAARHLWLLGASVITTYRDQYDIHDADLALGHQPEEPEQQAERDRAAAYLRHVTHDIARLEPDHPVEPPGRAAGRDPDLGR